MTMESALRGVAGVVVLATTALGYWVSPYFLIATAVVGTSLTQSAFTGWCPVMTVLKLLGVGRVRPANG